MGDSLDDELAALRRRAYGPGADISADDDALTRLRALEQRQRARRVLDTATADSGSDTARAKRSSDGSDQPTVAVAADASPDPFSGVDDESSPAPEATGDPEDASRRRIPWRSLLGACALTAVAVVAVTVPVTLWVAALPEQPYAVLHPIDAPPNTVFFSPESEAQRFEDFLGMHVSTGALDYQQGRCILVELQPDRADEFDSGGTRGACSAPGFEAVIDVSAVDSELSATARAALGDVTAVRFAVVGDEVHVFVANAPEPGSVS